MQRNRRCLLGGTGY